MGSNSDKYELTTGEDRTKVSLLACHMGSDLIVRIYNENAHIGAVAVGEYDHKENRASVSVITRLGHKDDAVAQKAAYLISKSVKRPVCVIGGGVPPFLVPPLMRETLHSEMHCPVMV